MVDGVDPGQDLLHGYRLVRRESKMAANCRSDPEHAALKIEFPHPTPCGSCRQFQPIPGVLEDELGLAALQGADEYLANEPDLGDDLLQPILFRLHGVQNQNVVNALADHQGYAQDGPGADGFVGAFVDFRLGREIRETRDGHDALLDHHRLIGPGKVLNQIDVPGNLLDPVRVTDMCDVREGEPLPTETSPPRSAFRAGITSARDCVMSSSRDSAVDRTRRAEISAVSL